MQIGECWRSHGPAASGKHLCRRDWGWACCNTIVFVTGNGLCLSASYSHDEKAQHNLNRVDTPHTRSQFTSEACEFIANCMRCCSNTMKSTWMHMNRSVKGNGWITRENEETRLSNDNWWGESSVPLKTNRSTLTEIHFVLCIPCIKHTIWSHQRIATKCKRSKDPMWSDWLQCVGCCNRWQSTWKSNKVSWSCIEIEIHSK